MPFQSEFTNIAIDDLLSCVRERKAEGARYVQTLAVNTEAGIDLIYTFMLGSSISNYKIAAVTKQDVVPSITDDFLAAFIWENEIHDLFGVTFEGIAIDFGGTFYALAEKEPMTIISPAQLAAREKAAKLAAAKAAKEKAAKEDTPAAGADAELEAKLAGMDPEKAAKVRAAMKAKAKKEAAEKAAKQDAELEAKLAGMDPEKAAKVRAAMEAKAKKEAAKAAAERQGE